MPCQTFGLGRSLSSLPTNNRFCRSIDNASRLARQAIVSWKIVCKEPNQDGANQDGNQDVIVNLQIFAFPFVPEKKPIELNGRKSRCCYECADRNPIDEPGHEEICN